MVGEDFRTFMGSFPRAAHPMSVLAAAVNALAAFYPDTTDITDSDQLDEAAKIIMAKARTVVSYIFRRRRDEPMLYPDLARGYVDDFLRMCFAVPYERFDSDPLYVHALGRLLIIHADHEQNCSTSVVRIAGSAHANLYAAISAGINALSGPLHGGANEAVLRQLKAIRDSGKSVRQFVEDAKAEGHRISGLGHRVYKSYDPRAAIARLYLEKIIAREDTRKLPADERALFDVAVELEDIALNDEYFVSRHLYPNVDFYTGLIYRAIGFDPAMFTTLFALGRIPGWIAQYREMLADPNTKIGRPRQVYTGEVERAYIPAPTPNAISQLAPLSAVSATLLVAHVFEAHLCLLGVRQRAVLLDVGDVETLDQVDQPVSVVLRVHAPAHLQRIDDAVRHRMVQDALRRQVDELDVELHDVVPDHRVVAAPAQEVGQHGVQRRCRFEHVRRDAGQLRDERIEVAHRIDQLLIGVDGLAVDDLHRSELDDGVPIPADTGGFQIQYDIIVGQCPVGQHRCLLPAA